MKRHGLDVTSQALLRPDSRFGEHPQVSTANILKSAHKWMLDYIRSRPVLGADETGVARPEQENQALLCLGVGG